MKLILLPGTDGTGQFFQPLIDQLDLECAIVSYPTDKHHDYKELEKMVRAELPRTEPYALLGESFSGPIAISIASSNPENLKGLILSASFASSPRPSLSTFSPMVNLFPKRVPIKILASILMGKFSTPELETTLRQCMNEVEPKVMRARLKLALKVDYRSKLQQVKTPTLYLSAFNDQLITKRSIDEFSRCCPHGEIIGLPGPHFLLQCSPKESADAILKFLNQLEQG